MQTSWVPLAGGENATRAFDAARAIASELRDAPGFGLSGGRAGLALFFAYLERALGDPEAGERAGELLEQAIDGLAEQPAPDPGLFHGFTGVAWVLEHLAGGGLSPEEEDPNADIDAALLALLRRGGPWQGEFDLLGGLVGWGVYALERLPRPSAAEMVPLLAARLADGAERGSHGAVWLHPRSAEREPDPGMAHGAAGVIALLARMLQEGFASPEAASLLEAAVDGVLRLPPGGEEGDLAWCSGDAGLSVALFAAARASGREDWGRAAHGLAMTAAKRYSDTEGLDTALCHGSAGLSHLFHRLHQATGDPALLAAAHRWLERTLARWRPGEGIGGFLSRGRRADGRVGWNTDPGFLGGAAGIGLALLAAASPVEPAWDRLLLLSGRY